MINYDLINNKNPSFLFIVLTLLTSYAFYALCTIVEFNFSIITISYMYIPMLCAMFIQNYNHQLNLPSSISFKFNRWFLVAWLLPLFIAFGSVIIATIFFDISLALNIDTGLKFITQSISPKVTQEANDQLAVLTIHSALLSVALGLLAGLTVNAVFAFGEEYGWRAFMLDAFKESSFFKASLIIGIVWGVWHAPLILHGYNYPQHPISGVFMMIALCILLSFLFNYITIKSKSIIATSIMHGSLNGTANISIILLNGGNDIMVGVTGLSGLIFLTILILALYFYDMYISKDMIMRRQIRLSLYC